MAETEQNPPSPDAAGERPAGADLKKDAKGKPGDADTGAAAGGGELKGADVYGGYDDDMGRGAD